MDSTVAADTTGNHPGQYLDGSYFATGAASSVTGHCGVSNSAAQFNKEAYVHIDAAADPNVVGDGGVFAQLPGGFTVELWFRLDQNPPTSSQLFSENLSGAGGPVIFLQFLNEGLSFDHISQNFTTAADMRWLKRPPVDGTWASGTTRRA